jgi:hypothetical protein
MSLAKRWPGKQSHRSYAKVAQSSKYDRSLQPFWKSNTFPSLALDGTDQ